MNEDVKDVETVNQQDNIEPTTEETLIDSENTLEANTLEGDTIQQEPEQENILTIRYNGEDISLSEEKAIELSQKGMNYDKINERYNDLKNNRGLQYIQKLAERSGMDIDSLVDYWENQEYEMELNRLVSENIPEEYAREIIESKKFREEYNKKLNEENEKNAKEQMLERERNDFLDMYGDVNPKDIPPVVWDNWKSGTPLKYAYMEYEREQLKNKIAILENNNSNIRKAPLTGIENDTNNNNEDSFMRGFNSI